MNQLTEHINTFITYLKVEKRMSVHTVNAYLSDLLQFKNIIDKNLKISNVRDITYNDLRLWMVQLKDLEITNRSINRKISTLKSFYKYLIRNEIIVDDISQKLISPKSSNSLPTFFSDKKMKVLLKEMAINAHNFNGLRDFLIIDLLYSTGIRQAELINIDINDVKGEYLKVLGKQNKERIVPLTSSLISNIKEYIKYREKENIQSTKLLLTDSGKKMYPKFVYRVVNKYIGYVTTESKRSPHTLRHSFATNTLNNGAQLNTIKEVLGHASLTATQVYTHNSIERLKEAYKKFHSKE